MPGTYISSEIKQIACASFCVKRSLCQGTVSIYSIWLVCQETEAGFPGAPYHCYPPSHSPCAPTKPISLLFPSPPFCFHVSRHCFGPSTWTVCSHLCPLIPYPPLKAKPKDHHLHAFLPAIPVSIYSPSLRALFFLLAIISSYLSQIHSLWSASWGLRSL